MPFCHSLIVNVLGEANFKCHSAFNGKTSKEILLSSFSHFFFYTPKGNNLFSSEQVGECKHTRIGFIQFMGGGDHVNMESIKDGELPLVSRCDEWAVYLEFRASGDMVQFGQSSISYVTFSLHENTHLWECFIMSIAIHQCWSQHSVKHIGAHTFNLIFLQHLSLIPFHVIYSIFMYVKHEKIRYTQKRKNFYLILVWLQWLGWAWSKGTKVPMGQWL